MLLRLDSETGPAGPEAEHFVQSALDALSAHIAILNDAGEIIGVNVAWREFASEIEFDHADSGIGLRYLAFCDHTSMYKPVNAWQIAAGIGDVISGKRDEFYLEYPCNIFPDQYWYVLSVSRFRVQGEKRVIIVHQDITELKHAQVDLAESRQEIQSVLDHISNAVFTVTPDGAIETCNPAAERIFGFRRNELVGMDITRLMSGSRYSRENLHELNGAHGRELVGKRRDGSEFPMYFDLTRMQVEKGHLYTVIVQDLTELKRMEAEMLEKERMRMALQKEQELRQVKNRFLSMMSHELRTPLASIRLSYDMLAQYGEQATEDERLLYLENIRVQVEHLSEVLGDVMCLTKLERSEVDFNPERCDLITFCRNIVESFQINHHHTHAIRFSCPDVAIIATIDKKLLRRALTNLIGNAIKYSPDGGNVEFLLQQVGDSASITLSDEGIGIPPEDAESLFDAFHRASNVGSLPGSGLGLAIVKQSVERHGGHIYLQPRQHIGSCFSIELPLHDPCANGRG